MAASGGDGPAGGGSRVRRIAIVADDLTGAADAAAGFATHGFATVVALSDAAAAAAPVVARFTGGRDLPEPEAVRRAEAVVAAFRTEGEPTLWYQKIDSVLRGHPGAELATTMRVLGIRRALVAPALPSEGRSVVAGQVLVDGRPLAESPFGGSGSGDIADRLRRHVEGSISHLTASELDEGLAVALGRLATHDHGVVVADARHDGDLELLVRAARAAGPMVLCGSAGLAKAVATVLALDGGLAGRAAPPPLPATARPILVVAGSHHPATARQITRLARRGAVVVRPSRLAPDEDRAAVNLLRGEIEAGIATSRDTVLTAIGCPDVRLDGGAIADRLAAIAAQPQVLSRIGGVVATGGEVAAALFRAAGATALRLGGEVRPAIPWGVLDAGMAAGIPVVTKAGSFGDDDTLAACVDFLRGADAGRRAASEGNAIASVVAAADDRSAVPDGAQ